MSRRYSEAEKAKALDLFVEIGPTKAAAELGIPKGTVAAWARKDGIKTQVSVKTRARIEARTLTLQERRAKLAQNLLEDAERLRADVYAEIEYFDWGGKDHTFDTQKVPRPIPADRLKLLQATSTALDQAEKLMAANSDTRTEAMSMLDRLAKAAGLPDTDRRS